MTEKDDLINACFRIDRTLYQEFRRKILGTVSVTDWIIQKMKEELHKTDSS